MPSDIRSVILDMVRNSDRPVKDIADAVGKPYSTLMRELDPGDARAKLGVELLLPLMLACDSTAPLRCLAEALDCRVVSNRGIIPDKPTFHEELLDTYQALADGAVDGEENPLVAIVGMRFHEVQKHLTLSNHARIGP